ncbi:MAG TPA: tetratricopeptide repeat protein [Polyangiaceae bacterium]|nr:tetratricopeptide repeat protein [Polyangiaceae bacterium]
MASALLVCGFALSACATNRPTAMQQAQLLADKGQHAAAAQVLERRLSEAPRDIEARRLLIRVYALDGQLGQSKRHAEVLFSQLGRGDAVPWVELGHALELNHRYDEALEHYDAAAAAAPKDPLGPLTGGLRAARWGEAEIAEPRLVEALRRDPRSAEAWHALGLVRLKLGDLQGAKSAYSSGLRADPHALENRLGLATVALAEGDAAAALAQYDAILAERPKFSDGELGRAWALIRLGRLDEAREALDRAYRLGANRAVIARQRRVLDELASAHK